MTEHDRSSRTQSRTVRDQAGQDVLDIADFVGKVETERAAGRTVPRPQPMQNVLGAFRGDPAIQTTVQILAAAATARHFGGRSSETARQWASLAQENAARLAAVRVQKYRGEQDRYVVQAQMPPEQIQQRMDALAVADHEVDMRVFDAAGALALTYAAVRSLPSRDTLVALSNTHLAADAEAVDLSERVLREADREQSAGSDREGIGSVLDAAGRGVATALGPVNGDDEVAAPLSSVDLNRLSQELVSALGAARKGHPRSVTEMLNAERHPDLRDEAAFVPEMTLERGPEVSL